MTWFGNEQDKMLAASKVRENPVPYADRLAFWQRVKARRKERAEQQAREDMDISRWLAEKAPTPVELWAQEAIDGANQWQHDLKAGTVTADKLVAPSIQWNASDVLREALDNPLRPVNPHERHVHVSNHDAPSGADFRMSDRDLFKKAIRDYGSRPVVSPPRRELEVLKVVDVDEVFWDIATMIDAHRNHCTALDDQRVPILPLSSPPIYTEVSTYLFDPRHEMGPRQRSWHRQNRTQPVNKSRSKRKGRR